MKFSLTEQVSTTYLSQADEIYLNSFPTDLSIYSLYPNATFNIPYNGEDISSLPTSRTLLRITNLSLLPLETSIPYYTPYTPNTPYELNSLISLGVSQVNLNSPLLFQLPSLPTTVSYRCIANVANDGFFPPNPPIDFYILPQTLPTYSPYITTLSFEDASPHKEEALFRIYSKDGWSGKVSDLISNCPTTSLNRLIPPDFAEKRINCGQRCLTTSGCRFCYRIFHLAEPEFASELVNLTKTANKD